ncbi:hypothetical protein D3C87_1782420 [compost metagenome]
MCQVATSVQRHAQNGVAGLDQRLVDALIGLGAGIGLHIGEADAKQLLGALDSQRLGDVHILATAVVTLARIAFGIFVGQHRALRFQHGTRDDVFRSDQLDFVLLASQLVLDGLRQLRIGFSNRIGEEVRKKR